MRSSLHARENLNLTLLRYRWPFVMLVSSGAILFEVFEHRPLENIITDIDFWRETAVFGVLGPLILGIVLTSLVSTRSAWSRSLFELNLQRKIRRVLVEASTSQELATSIFKFLRSLFPLTAASLVVYDHISSSYQPVLTWSLEGGEPGTEPEGSRGAFPGEVQPLPYGTIAGMSLTGEGSFQASTRNTPYCLPLRYADFPVAMLYFYLPERCIIDPAYLNFLNDISAEIGAAVHRTLRADMFKRQDQAVETVQHQIARDLHDTLGHNIAFIRMKLDMMIENREQVDIKALLDSLRLVRDAADESYDQLRDTLNIMLPETARSLSEALEKHARKVGQRANIDIRVMTFGEPKVLPPYMHRQVFLIFREALNNIVKHARAQMVEVQLIWDSENFYVTIQDDGKGFLPDIAMTDGHFGIKFMRERAEGIGGSLSVESTLNTGTRVSLKIPAM